MISILYIILALLGISFLIFIHELGHYWMACKERVKVETFAIGLGKSIYQWERKGVIWKIGMIPFGGYVKMASEGEDSFYSKTPWQRCKIAFAGPFINLLFAFIAFSFLALFGGRNTSFAEHSKYIGWVDRDSKAYQENVRPGDEIDLINHTPFTGFQNFLHGAAFNKQDLTIEGMAIDYFSGEKTPFSHVFQMTSQTKGVERAFPILKTLNPAYYLIYEGSPLPSSANQKTPLELSGIAKGDRLLWVDGELIFSQPQLIQAINSPRVLLTVQRGDTIFLSRIPRLKIGDLRIENVDKEELSDLRFEASLTSKLQDLFFIPYNIDSKGVVKEAWGYIDEKSRPVNKFIPFNRAIFDRALEKGDKIVAVQGEKISSSVEILKIIQEKKTFVIIERQQKRPIVSWEKANEEFVASFHGQALSQLASSIGTHSHFSASNSNEPGLFSLKLGEGKELILLKAITPISMNEFISKIRAAKEEQDKTNKEVSEEQIQQKAVKVFEAGQNWLVLGAQFKDQMVTYNPSPFVVFGQVTKEVFGTLRALFTGGIKANHLSGPVGIIQVMQRSWGLGIKEVLYFMGLLSLNLGIFNLLPLPILDGGAITISLFEMMTKKPLKQKTLERLIIPFAVLLILFILYLTYHDLIRLFKNFF